MTVLRIAAGIEKDFFMASNDFARDKTISPRAVKIYIYLISHQEGWRVSVRSVARETGLSKNTVAAALRDLEDAGFIDRQQVKDKTGQFAGTEYVVHQRRQPRPKNRDTVKNDEKSVPNIGLRSDQQEQDESAGSDRSPNIGLRSDQQEQDESAGQNRYPNFGSHKNTNSKKIKEEGKASSADDSELASKRLAPHLDAARAVINRARKHHAA